MIFFQFKGLIFCILLHTKNIISIRKRCLSSWISLRKQPHKSHIHESNYFCHPDVHLSFLKITSMIIQHFYSSTDTRIYFFACCFNFQFCMSQIFFFLRTDALMLVNVKCSFLTLIIQMSAVTKGQYWFPKCLEFSKIHYDHPNLLDLVINGVLGACLLDLIVLPPLLLDPNPMSQSTRLISC